MRRLILVLCLAGCLWAPASARADVEERVSGTGGMTVSWHGEPARGCAGQGVCDVRGSVVLDPSENQGTSTSSGSSDFPSVDLDLDRAVVRVTRGPAGDPGGSCIDLLEESSLTFLPEPPDRTGAVRIRPTIGFGESVLSAGRCAGPTVADLADALPSLRVPRSAFRRPRQRFDMTLKRSFGAGPFTVEVDSTIVVAVRRREVRRRPSPFGEGERERVRVRPRAVLTAVYAVRAGTSPMTMSFSGLVGRGCEVLDACGVSGTTTVGLRGEDETRVELRASGPATLARGGGTGRAIAALAAGRLKVERIGGAETVRARLDGEVRRAGSAAVCRDGRDVDLPPLELVVRPRRARLAIGGEQYGGNTGALRTRCAGPGGGNDGPLAAGIFPTRDLGGERVTVPLALVAEDPWPFAVTTTATATLTLRRVSARVRIEQVPDL